MHFHDLTGTITAPDREFYENFVTLAMRELNLSLDLPIKITVEKPNGSKAGMFSIANPNARQLFSLVNPRPLWWLHEQVLDKGIGYAVIQVFLGENRMSTLTTLAHELVHASDWFSRQFAYGDIKTFYYGEDYPDLNTVIYAAMDITEYIKIPWEIKAYKMQYPLAEKVAAMLGKPVHYTPLELEFKSKVENILA